MIARRVFLKHGALALVSLGWAPRFLVRTAAASEQRRRVLVAIFQRGALDGLNAVVPFGDREYYRARPSIALPPPGAGAEGVIDLDGFFGLHPRLAPLKPLYDRGRLAVVHACGSPNPTRSHFEAQEYMESATPGITATPDGWLNRCLRARPVTAASPLRAVSLTPHLPRSLQGRAPALAIGRLDRFGLAGEVGAGTARLFEELYTDASDPSLRSAGSDIFEAVRLLRSVGEVAARKPGRSDYPRSAFGVTLQQLAQLVKAEVGVEIAFAETGG